MPPVLRFAPSPNGLLHLGHAYSALCNEQVARRFAGRLLLRIEDIDPQRCRPAFETALIEDLDWLGIRFAPEVRRQSAHMEEYAAALARLRRDDLVYACFCSRNAHRQQVEARRRDGTPWPCDPDGTPWHAGRCASLPRAVAARRIAEGEPHRWRLAMDGAIAAAGCGPAGPPWRRFDPETGVAENVQGEVTAWGDVVLGRREVPASYHLCVVLDDALQGVTHIVRGKDLERASEVHALLQRLLGLPEPRYHHHRLILDAQGRKLSKSAGSPALRAMRRAGHGPDTVRALLGLA